MTKEEMEKRIAELEKEKQQLKAESQEVKITYENRQLTATVDIPSEPTGKTKSGNNRYVKQHYRYWKVPGSNLKVKVDIIEKTNGGNNDE